MRRVVLASSALAAATLFAARLGAQAPLAGRPAAAATPVAASEHVEPALGYSGKLRVAIVHALAALDFPLAAARSGPRGTTFRWVPLFGTRTQLLGDAVYRRDLRAPAAPGVWRLVIGQSPQVTESGLAFVTEVPFARKRNGYLNGYHIGSYPTEGSGRTDRYAPPAGFIEVTPGNEDMWISEHFQLKQFVTHDQQDVWPKYVALDARLIDKLELVMQELNQMGVRAEHYYIMSGYRTPQYNGPGGDGRAALSRHMYGDAADGWVDNDQNGYMDDLNGDGRVDIRDAAVIRRAVDRVEREHPDLVGGAGLYAATDAHGPFIHIDTRGYRARW
ncbi:MAG TPA: hypothetical protein VFL93_04130 [Longimicrobiaceae bacterium]|nr:hypothetical protein [Longimicrobiaceae bacterium]